MISYMTLLLAILMLALCLQTANSQPHSLTLSSCCNNLMKVRLKKAKIERFYHPHGCTRKDVVFVTKRGLQFCADPKEDWVKNIIKKLSK
ncbi:C-C motif chemokine 22 [Huso huso]|uniref:C-C motif chemokine 22 n=1 Tax=Huso huso TaxID=61971 RepID=A0ABR0YXT2_HUSHU